MIPLYYCDIPEVKDMTVARHEVWRQHPGVRCHSTCEDMTTGRGSSTCVAVETMAKNRRVKELEEKVGSLAKKGRSKRRRNVQNEIGFLVCKQSLAERPSFLERSAEVMEWRWRTNTLNSRLSLFTTLDRRCGDF